ncbi:MAG: hypothetical protein HZB39_16750 [Planctomycetes bacterium]|nr:hypothetical protein [Planctomycetota bacterium]
MTRRRAPWFALLACAACDGTDVVVPDFAQGIPGSAFAVGRAPDVAARAVMRRWFAAAAESFQLTLGEADDSLWLIDARTPSPVAELRASRTFREAHAVRPAPEGANWIWLDLQAGVDGARARLADRFAVALQVVDLLDLRTLEWAAGEIEIAGDHVACDLTIHATSDASGPLAWFVRGDATPSLLADPRPDDRAALEIRFEPRAVVRALASPTRDARPSEFRFDGAVFDIGLAVARSLASLLDGRFALRIDRTGAVAIALGVEDGERARAGIEALVPRLGEEPLRLPGGLGLRFEPRRILLDRGASSPAGSFAPPAAFWCDLAVPDGRRLYAELAREDLADPRLHLRLRLD